MNNKILNELIVYFNDIVEIFKYSTSVNIIIDNSIKKNIFIYLFQSNSIKPLTIIKLR